MSHDFTLHQYRTFLKVAELGSITRAANALTIPQPSVSRSISKIETALEVKLIERHRNGVVLTAAGARFQTHVGEALRHAELAAIAAVEEQSIISGEVRFAAPESIAGILFKPLVQQFGELYPHARIRVMTSASAHIPTLMDNRVVDIGIIADTHTAPSAPTETLCREAFYLIGPRDSSEISTSTIALKQVARLPLILNAMQGGFRARIDEAFRQRDLSPIVVAEIDANEPLLDLVLDEAGYSILPFSAIARQHRVHQFTTARIVAPEISRRLKLVQSTQQPLTAIGRKSLRLIREIATEQAAAARWQMLAHQAHGRVDRD